MRNLIHALITIFLVVCGNVIGTQPSSAAPPVWPKCARTRIDHDTMRIWLDPGTMYKTDKVHVMYSFPDKEAKMKQHRDGIWVLDIPVPAKYTRNVLHFTFNTDGDGSWIECKKVWR